MTDELKKIADEFIAHFKRQEGAYFSKSDLIGIIRANANVEPLHAGKVNVMLWTLVNKGFLAVGEHDNIHLTPKGWEYESFDKVLADEQKQKRLEILQIKSSIRTNISVRKTNNIQIGVLILTAVLSAFSLLFSYLDYKKESITNVAAPKVRVQLPPRVLDKDTLMQNTLDTLP